MDANIRLPFGDRLVTGVTGFFGCSADVLTPRRQDTKIIQPPMNADVTPIFPCAHLPFFPGAVLCARFPFNLLPRL